MTFNDDDALCDDAQLRSLYRPAAEGALRKAITFIDAGAREFIERSPLVVLATGHDGRLDASPRGGPPGFVRVIEDRALAFGDLVGNNRLDSYRNLVAQPGIGMLFFVPGMLETLRVNGRAHVSVSLDVRRLCALEGRVPKVAVVVSVEECFLHCGAALRRSSLWDASTWPGEGDRPSAGRIFKGHLEAGEVTAEQIERELATYYETEAWTVGGDPEAP